MAMNVAGEASSVIRFLGGTSSTRNEGCGVVWCGEMGVSPEGLSALDVDDFGSSRRGEGLCVSYQETKWRGESFFCQRK